MAKLKGFGAAVIDGKLVLEASDRTLSMPLPVTIYTVRVLIGNEITGHSIEATISPFKGEEVFDRQEVHCDTIAEMEREAVRLLAWAHTWKNKKMNKAWMDRVRDASNAQAMARAKAA